MFEHAPASSPPFSACLSSNEVLLTVSSPREPKFLRLLTNRRTTVTPERYTEESGSPVLRGKKKMSRGVRLDPRRDFQVVVGCAVASDRASDHLRERFVVSPNKTLCGLALRFVSMMETGEQEVDKKNLARVRCAGYCRTPEMTRHKISPPPGKNEGGHTRNHPDSPGRATPSGGTVLIPR